MTGEESATTTSIGSISGQHRLGVGLPDPAVEATLLAHLERTAAARYGDEGYYIDGERRRIPDHWHAHARPAGGFFDPRSALFGDP